MYKYTHSKLRHQLGLRIGSAIRLKVKVFDIQRTNSARPLAQGGIKDLLMILSAQIKGFVIKANKFYPMLHRYISISHSCIDRLIRINDLLGFRSKHTYAHIVLVVKWLKCTIRNAVKDLLRQRRLVSKWSPQSDSIH